MSSRKLRRTFISKSELVLEALLNGPLCCGELAERVGVTKQHLSRLLRVLTEHHLILRRAQGPRRVNSLTSTGRLLAENTKESLEIIRRLETGDS